jgi:Cu-processing system permease protein
VTAAIGVNVPELVRIRARSMLANIRTIAARELRESLSSRWFLLYTIAFAVLGLGVSYVSATSLGGAGLAGFGRTSAGLVNLVLLVVPLMSLTAGAGTIASDRERGMLAYLLAQPVSRLEVLLGKYLGAAVTLSASILLGFGACALVLAWKGAATKPASLALLVGLTLLLSLAMLSVGVLISVLARKTSVAVGTAVFLWLVFVFVSDLGLMAAAMTFKLEVEGLFALAMCNPLQVFKMWALTTVDASLDVLGPAGLYAQETFRSSLAWMFAGSLVAWIILPLIAASMIFKKRSPL